MVERRDVEAALEARRELGPQYERDIVDSLVDKIEKRLDERQVERHVGERHPAQRSHPDVRVAFWSMALAVGATAIAVGNGAAWLAVIVWVCVAAINIAYATRR